jgi:fructose-1,6-bisphosphatase
MKRPPKLSILRGLLFLFDIDNNDDSEKERIIVSKDVNNAIELAELFDMLMRPEFNSYSDSDREWYIDTLIYYLGVGESFDSIFDKITTYFDDEVEDRRKFMQVLLECLLRYQAELVR